MAETRLFMRGFSHLAHHVAWARYALPSLRLLVPEDIHDTVKHTGGIAKHCG